KAAGERRVAELACTPLPALASSICALASAVASAAIDALDRCMARLRAQKVKADGAGFGALGAHAMADRLLGVLRHQPLQLGLGLLMLEIGRPGAGKDAGELGPGIG